MRSIRVIGIVLIVCVVLLIATCLLREGYEDDGGAYERQKDLNDSVQGEFLESRRRAYNSIGMAMTTAGTQGNLGSSTAPIMGTLPANNTIGSDDKYSNIPLDTKATGVFDLVKVCEVVNTTDCSAFDDPEFSANCGMCLDLGPADGPAMNSDIKPAVGGRVLLADERKMAETRIAGFDPNNKSVSTGILPDYIPTLGTCPVPKRMASNKGQCLRIKREMACQKNANYDQANCSQCFGDGNYSIVDPKITPNVFAGAGTLVLFGEGILNFTEGVYQTKSKIILSNTNAVRIALQGPEMTRLSFKVDAVDESSPPVFIAGYLTGVTASGDFTVDLIRTVLNDAVTGRKPLTGGSISADGMKMLKMIAGFGQTTLSLQAVTPFTFVDPYTMEAATCSSSPYVTTQAGAEFLASNPCYKKGSGPGKYSLECLQNVFLSNGGLQSGKGYPSDSNTASVLMTDSNGKSRSLDEIANFIYPIALISATGVSISGEKQTIQDWSAASVFCTGKEILTPCDTYGKDTGPLSDDCLAYLWDNMGSLNSLGGTYSGISMAKSLFNSGNTNQNSRFCQRSGTMSPIDMNGKKNSVALAYWKKRGGVSAVKAAMKEIHDMANNDDYVMDEDRGPYISQCYGDIPMAVRPGPIKIDCPKTGCGTMARYVRFWTSTDRLQISQIMIFDIYHNNLALNSKPKMISTYPVFGTKVEDTINGDTSSGCCGVIGEAGYFGMIEYDLGKPCDIISVLFFQQKGRTQVGGRIALADVSFNDPNGRTEIISKKIDSEKSPIKFSFVTSNPSAECLKCINYCPYPAGSDMIGLCY